MPRLYHHHHYYYSQRPLSSPSPNTTATTTTATTRIINGFQAPNNKDTNSSMDTKVDDMVWHGMAKIENPPFCLFHKRTNLLLP
mmetsp:Transcript_852/g.942  ORF Transcript_852/g.942 Transcript_852/m.942 type:complete len:84 (-) Transcript_852:834-1085(-)